MTIQPKKNPLWFSIVAIIAILWNLVGVAIYLGQVTMSDEDKMLLDPQMLIYLESTPKLITALFAIAVWFSFIASILLLLKKIQAVFLFSISLIAVLINTTYDIFFTDIVEIMGATSYYSLQTTIVLIAVFLVFHSRKAAKLGWIS